MRVINIGIVEVLKYDGLVENLKNRLLLPTLVKNIDVLRYCMCNYLKDRLLFLPMSLK